MVEQEGAFSVTKRMHELFHRLIGPDTSEIAWWQMAIRGIIVFLIALALIRFGNSRIFGKNTAFDIVLGIVFGSILSRAITGNSPFLPTIFSAVVLIGLHRFFGFLAVKNNHVGTIIKGSAKLIVENGMMHKQNMEGSNITENDLLEACRLSGIIDLGEVKAAYLERSGNISIIKADDLLPSSPGHPEKRV